jgi:MauM/NapG family ferredoxin protein
LSERDATTENRNFRRYRQFVRGAALVIAIVLLRRGYGAIAVPGLSPFIALASMLAIRAFHVVALLGLAITVVVLVHPRWYCRWLCPMGLCGEGASRLGRHFGRKTPKAIPLGQWILWLTLGGALFGRPLLLWLDPLAIFSGLFSLKTAGSISGVWLLALPATVVLLLSVAWPYIWCGRLCPLGALQYLLALPGRRWHKRTGWTSDSGLVLGRRAILGAAVGAVSASALKAVGTPVSRPLRPPGALDEPEFLGACVRCGNCLRACPSQIIQPDLGGHGLTSLLSPILSFADDYCREDCVACTSVCPSGALSHVLVHVKPRHRIGVPKVDMNICLLGEDRECAECRRWCPYGAIRYVFSESEYCLKPQIDEAKCNGCGACEKVCPTSPQKAIVVRPLPV